MRIKWGVRRWSIREFSDMVNYRKWFFQYNGREKLSHRRAIPVAAPLCKSPLPIWRKKLNRRLGNNCPGGERPDMAKQACFAGDSSLEKLSRQRRSVRELTPVLLLSEWTLRLFSIIAMRQSITKVRIYRLKKCENRGWIETVKPVRLQINRWIQNSLNPVRSSPESPFLGTSRGRQGTPSLHSVGTPQEEKCHCSFQAWHTHCNQRLRKSIFW